MQPKEVKEERKIQTKKQKKNLHHTTDNYNHFLMYEKDGSSAHVVDEDWFHENDHEHNIEIRRITQETIKKCIEKQIKCITCQKLIFVLLTNM